MRLSKALYNLDTAAAAEELRVQANEAMAAAFEQVDLIIAATNPGPAFAAESAMSNPDESFVDWAKGVGRRPLRVPGCAGGPAGGRRGRPSAARRCCSPPWPGASPSW